MPGRCCVPLCKGNYPTGPKVSVFSFPKNEDLKREWLSAIQRKDFSPKKSSKVCELHFKKSDFKVEASAFDSKNGILISAPLQVFITKKGVFLS
ncbi:THAP domain-containing protein 6-like [Stegodyphus dumicola]|uniref:THAP domain-containing protein 6-like n=1 Tax=Stegodyphus dumicola TaxID=202533 RepID=UPI0015AD6661|nr:THAP domain-containing protein 6-like [Stegodyphus dumicola]